MGEKEQRRYTEESNFENSREADHLAPITETATVPDSSKQQEKRAPHMLREYAKLVEPRVTKAPVRPSPFLKTIGDLYIAKELLLTKIEKLQAENQELRQQEEQRKKQNREAYERYVQKDPEAYRAKKRQEMRQRRAAQK